MADVEDTAACLATSQQRHRLRVVYAQSGNVKVVKQVLRCLSNVSVLWGGDGDSGMVRAATVSGMLAAYRAGNRHEQHNRGIASIYIFK